MLRGTKYHFSLREQPCRVGIFKEKSKIKIHDEVGPEWLIKLDDGTVLIERQIISIRLWSEYSFFETSE